MAWVEDWTIAAGCRGMDPDELFVQGAAQNRAKVVCATCPVRTECLADALDNRVEYGVWGGMTERERRALLRRRPEVRSWRQVLEEKRDAYLERTGGVLLMPEASSLLAQSPETVSAEVLVEAEPVAAG
ncbi:MAG TPA: WhiB family transcriptional regulator [Streptosporangiaceae bacterium]